MDKQVSSVVSPQTTLEQNSPTAFEKSKGISCGKILGGCLIVIIIIFLATLLFGYRMYILSKQPVNLGVSYTQQDFENFKNKISIELVGDPQELCFTCPVLYEGEKEANIKLTNEEASAWVDLLNKKLQLTENTQVQFENNLVNISTITTYEGIRLPVYVSLSITKVGSKSVYIDIKEVQIGKALSLPIDSLDEINSELNDFVNKKLNEMEGFSIDSLTFEHGYMSFKGTLPEKISGMKKEINTDND